jgi:phosphatidylglycerophosphate synthase
MTAHARIVVKAKDAWWTVAVVDPVAAPLLRAAFRRPWVTPNRLSVASALTAVASAGAFAAGSLVAGAVLYQVSFLFDCMDGKLAQSRGETDPLGAYVDTLVDMLRLLACYAGLVWAISGGDLSRSETLMVALFLPLALAGIRTGAVAPSRSETPAPLLLAASALAFVRAAPRRLGLPGTSVDAEALVFTLGPLTGRPVIAIELGCGLMFVHLVAPPLRRGWRFVRARRRRGASDVLPMTEVGSP